jgi:hypothetical protein
MYCVPSPVLARVREVEGELNRENPVDRHEDGLGI